MGKNNKVTTDAHGELLTDPSKNVLDLVEAGMLRQDDLRIAERRLRRAEMGHVHQMAKLREKYAAKLRKAEAKRIDAIRAVDVGAGNRAAEVAADAASALAAQLVATAEANRVQVESTRAATADSLAQALTPIQSDIRALRDAQSETLGGKEQVITGRSAADDMKPLVDAIERLVARDNQAQGANVQAVDTRTERTGRNQSIGLWIAGTGTAVAAIFGIAGIAIAAITK